MPIRYGAPDPLAKLRTDSRNWNDEFLAHQYHLGRRSYTSDEAWEVIRSEFHERGLASDDSSQEKALDSVDPTFDTPEGQVAYAAERLQEGASWMTVEAEIRDAGPVTDEVHQLLREFAVARHEQAERYGFQGLLWFGGGLAVTAITYVSATPGGTYILAWGAVLFGAIQAWQGYAVAGEPLPPEDAVAVEPALEDHSGSHATI